VEYLGWSYNGLTFGNGTSLGVIETDGFDDLPPIRSADAPKAGSHGSFAGLDLLGERTMTITMAVQGTDRSSYDALVQQLSAAFVVQSADLPLLCGDNGNRRINCRPRKMALPRKRAFHGTFHDAALIELVAVDPRVYDAVLQQPNTGMAATAGGMTFNATFPLAFGSAGAGGSLMVTNAGSFATDWTATIAGPVVNPVIDNLSTGVSIQLAITLNVGDSLVLDSLSRTIRLNGTASRTSTLQPGSTWWTLPPGTTLLRFRNNGASDVGTLTFAFRSAWMALASGGA
jgi:hypothetical protein